MATEARSTKTTTIDRSQRLQIVGASLCDERSVAAVYGGRVVKSSTYTRVVRAAESLRLPAPPPQPTK